MARRCRLQEELASAELGDARRVRRLGLLASRLGTQPQSSIPEACRGWAETVAAYRLLNSAAVGSDEVLAAHREATIQRASGTRELLMLQDTTEVDYSGHDALEGAGPLAEDRRRGFFAHSRLVVAEEEGVILGLEGSKIWARSESRMSKKRPAKRRVLKQKESLRWLQGYQRGCELLGELPSGTRLTVVGDRESDIYELFSAHAEAEGKAADFLVRACQDRALIGGGKLFEAGRQARVLGHYCFEVRAAELIAKVKGNRRRVSRKARQARMTVRSCRLTLRPPQRPAGQKLPPVEVEVICACEENPPKGQTPVEWILLTSWKARSLKQAKRLLRIYSLRWLCEEFHYVLKSGCGVEDLALRDGAAIGAALALYMVIAWRILYLRDFSRAQPGLSSKHFFDPIEWQTAGVLLGIKCTNRGPPQLGKMIRMIATLGGYLGRTADAEPGAKTIWRGLTRLADAVLMWEDMSNAAGR